MPGLAHPLVRCQNLPFSSPAACQNDARAYVLPDDPGMVLRMQPVTGAYCDEVNEALILGSWTTNAAPWIRAVRERQIESRRLVTDGAILAAIQERSPRSVLDIGCGEGWLVRALAREGIRSMGVDAVPQLIEQAREAGGGDFRALSFDDLAAGKLFLRADVAVCNFSLLGNESVRRLLRTVPSLLTPSGVFAVQTLHPMTACGESPYCSGWRPGDWAGLSGTFTDPAPWYFRTLQGWVELIQGCGLELLQIREPLHPVTQRPASIIFITAPKHWPRVSQRLP
jgi:2-polyprenyl-3-methyl-5-hydroxy-6-metoxy-1,4-benzoquinol methylase